MPPLARSAPAQRRAQLLGPGALRLGHANPPVDSGLEGFGGAIVEGLCKAYARSRGEQDRTFRALCKVRRGCRNVGARLAGAGAQDGPFGTVVTDLDL